VPVQLSVSYSTFPSRHFISPARVVLLVVVDYVVVVHFSESDSESSESLAENLLAMPVAVTGQLTHWHASAS
jgi:hypothetical protein